jgi:hypothetical protein
MSSKGIEIAAYLVALYIVTFLRGHSENERLTLPVPADKPADN